MRSSTSAVAILKESSRVLADGSAISCNRVDGFRLHRDRKKLDRSGAAVWAIVVAIAEEPRARAKRDMVKGRLTPSAALSGSLRHPVSGRDPQEGDDDDRDDSFGRGWFGPGWGDVAQTQARGGPAPAGG